MTIATDITGNAGQPSQVLDIIAMVAKDPKAYDAKIKELKAETERHKAFVEAVAPASEVMALREQTAQDRVEAKEALKTAKAEAKKIVSDAQAKARDIGLQASEKAKAISMEAQMLMDKAEKDMAAVEAQRGAVRDAMAEAKGKKQEAAKALEEAQALKESLAKAKAESDELRGLLKAKLAAFAKSAGL